MFSPEVVTEVIKNHKGFSPKGISCHFIRLDEKWGVKVYREPSVRNIAFTDQNKMATYGYAPAVGISFDTGETYCYITEIAKPLIDGCSAEEDYKEWDERYKKIQNTPGVLESIDKLVGDMEKVGYYMTDAHCANFGHLEDKLVCIDFGGY